MADRSSIRLSAREMLVVCAAILSVVVLPVGVNVARGAASNAGAWSVGGDFVSFYVAGRILNDHRDGQLYDLAVQEKYYREVTPELTTRRFAYPPFIAVLFRPLAWFGMPRALAIFMAVTPLAFFCALRLLDARFGLSGRYERALFFLAALSFFPFLGYTWLGAQISTIAFFSIALALHAEDRGELVASGLALSLCLYKPTLLVLILPMLLVTGSGRQLAGFAAGAVALTVLSVLAAGTDAVRGWAAQLTEVVARSTAENQVFNVVRWVDLNAFFRLLPFGRSLAGRMALGLFVSVAAIALVAVWLRTRAAGRPERLLVWAATLTATLVLNIYTPMYDSVLVVAAAIAAVAAVRDRGWEGWNRLGPALAVLYISPLVAEISARELRFQVYTVVLCAFGTLLLFEAANVQKTTSSTSVNAGTDS